MRRSSHRATSKPQLAGSQRRHRHAARLQPRHPGPVRTQPRASWRRPVPARRRPAAALSCPAGVSKRKAPSPSQPSQRWRMWNCTVHRALSRRWRRRCSQARSSGAAFMSAGNTRPDVPTKVSMPSPCAQARRARAPKCAQQRLDGRLPCAEARDEAIERLGVREVEPAACPASRNLRPDRGHGVHTGAPARRRPTALRRPSAPRGRRR